MDVHDEAIRIWQQERRIVGNICHLKHHAGISRLVLRHADLLQEPVLHIEALADQNRGKLGIGKIEEDAVGAGHTSRSILHFAVNVNGHASVIRS